MNYEELVKALRILQDKNSLSYYKRRVCKDAADAIEALQAEIRESMQTCAECGDEQEQKVKELQARLGEAENSAERWKDMYLTKHEPKRGEWELIDGAEPMRWGCSRCKYLSWETSNYCPRCGAKMEVQE